MADFIYACIQLIHNLGAVAVVGSPAVAWWLVGSTQRADRVASHPLTIGNTQRTLTWLTLIAWSTQALSGIGFGTTTYILKHQLPELTGVGLSALVIKVTCAIISLTLALIYLQTGSRWSSSNQLRVWQGLFALGLAALVSAAFLRWYA